MTREQALAAASELASSPAARWIGNRKISGNDTEMLQRCTRCGIEETITLPLPVRELAEPQNVPAGLDEKLFAWKREFQKKHEGCTEP